jgi:hypothetical protein
MSPDAMIPVLLIVGFLVSITMAGIARQKIPGSAEYREEPAPHVHAYAERRWGDTRMHAGYRSGDGLGRGSGGTSYARAQSWPGYERHEDALGRGYGRTGEGAYARRERPRYHANGSSAQGRHDPFEHGPDEGFEAWARANGFRWHDASSQPPPPPPPPSVPHWSRVLGIPRTAGVAEIRKAYARTMRGLHPDVVAQTALTSQRCTEARIAYDQAREDAQRAGRP